MTAELVRGQNHPLPDNRLEIRVAAGTPVVAAITLGDEQGRVADAAGTAAPAEAAWLAHPGRPHLPGIEVPRQAAAEHRLAVDLGALSGGVHRVHVLLCLPPAGRPDAPADFGAVQPPRVAVTTPDGTSIAGFTLTGLGPETALLAVELYRRQGAWKIRAVGQGYAGGLAALLADQAVPDAPGVAAVVHAAATRESTRAVPAPRPAPAASAPPAAEGRAADPAAAGTGIDYRHPRRRPEPTAPEPAAAGPAVDRPSAGPQAPSTPQPAAQAPSAAPATPAPAPDAPPVPVAGDAPGWSMEERLYNQIWGMFEDLARCVAAYRSAEDFARSRYEQELDRLLADPRTRGGPAADAARDAAELRMVALVDQARAVLDRDLAQLTAEAAVVEPALPPALAGWDNPCWHAYQVPAEPPLAVRLGELTLPEAPTLRIPLLMRLPLDRGLWVDSSQHQRLALDVAVAIAARLLASFPVGGFTVHTLDPAGSGTAALAPLKAPVVGGLVPPPPAAGAAGVAEVLDRLTARVDLLQMALRGGAPDALPPGFDTAEQLLVVNEFPYGFDDRALQRLRFLADEGPAVGVHVLLVGDGPGGDGPPDAASARYADPRRSMLRLTPLPEDHLADPWVGHAWTYEPSLVPPGSQVLAHVLARVAAARPAYGP